MLRAPRRRGRPSCHDAPDGVNINDGCGSTHPEALQREVVASGRDAGLAFDGDADRVLAVDHTGRPGRRRPAHRHLRPRPPGAGRAGRRHGGRHRHDQPRLPPGHGRRTASPWSRPTSATATCSRRWSGGGWSLGGEQSGHIIFGDLATTGDGVLTGLQVLDVMVRTGRSPGRPGRGAWSACPRCCATCRWPSGAPTSRGSEDLTHGGQGGRGRAGRPGPGAGPAERHRGGRPGHGRGR